MTTKGMVPIRPNKPNQDTFWCETKTIKAPSTKVVPQTQEDDIVVTDEGWVGLIS